MVNLEFELTDNKKIKIRNTHNTQILYKGKYNVLIGPNIATTQEIEDLVVGEQSRLHQLMASVIEQKTWVINYYKRDADKEYSDNPIIIDCIKTLLQNKIIKKERKGVYKNTSKQIKNIKITAEQQGEIANDFSQIQNTGSISGLNSVAISDDILNQQKNTVTVSDHEQFTKIDLNESDTSGEQHRSMSGHNSDGVMKKVADTPAKTLTLIDIGRDIPSSSGAIGVSSTNNKKKAKSKNTAVKENADKISDAVNSGATTVDDHKGVSVLNSVVVSNDKANKQDSAVTVSDHEKFTEIDLNESDTSGEQHRSISGHNSSDVIKNKKNDKFCSKVTIAIFAISGGLMLCAGLILYSKNTSDIMKDIGAIVAIIGAVFLCMAGTVASVSCYHVPNTTVDEILIPQQVGMQFGDLPK